MRSKVKEFFAPWGWPGRFWHDQADLRPRGAQSAMVNNAATARAATVRTCDDLQSCKLTISAPIEASGTYFDGHPGLSYTLIMDIQFSVQIFKEGRMFVAYTPELDVSSCGGTQKKATANLLEAVHLFLKEAGKMGTLRQILEEAGFVKRKSTFCSKIITTQQASLPLILADD